MTSSSSYPPRIRQRVSREILASNVQDLVNKTITRLGNSTSTNLYDCCLVDSLFGLHKFERKLFRLHRSLFPDRYSDLGWRTLGRPCVVLDTSVTDSVISDTPLIIHGTLASRSVAAKEDQAGWIEKTKQFLVHDSTLDVTIKKPGPCLVAPSYRSTKDAFMSLPELDPYKAFCGEALNPIVRMPKYDSVNYEGDFTAPTKNARGNIKNQQYVKTIGTSNGLRYVTADESQTLLSVATRYAGIKKQFVMDDEGRQLARDIATNMFDKIIDKERLTVAWNDNTMSDVYKGWLAKAQSAAYASSHTVAMEDQDRIVRFHGKGSFKPKEGEITSDGLHKAPQGISAWSKGANSFFGYACRMISEVTRQSLKEEAVWNNGISIDEAAKRFGIAAAKVPSPMNVRIDAIEMDSKQNQFTHTIVAEFIKLLCVSDEFVELYFSMMQDYDMVCDAFKIHLQWVKCSGEPFTLFGNTFLMVSLTLWLIRGEGPYALFGQGDDVDLNQANMRVDTERRDDLALYCAFDMTMEWGEYAAFCGFIYKDGVLCPNIRRKFIKILGMTQPSTKHFQVVQQAIRDWTKSIKDHVAFSDILRLNAEVYGMSQDNIETLFEAIDSVGHISAKQYESIACTVPLSTDFISSSGYVNSNY